jgi:TRAP-type C4-dicarboxylate transport system permease small subunit
MHQTIDTIARILTFVTQTFDKIGAWIVLPAISVVMMTDVILRYVFNSPLIWGLEFGEWMLLFIFVAAIPECTRRHGHIRMELLYGVMPLWFRKAITVLYAIIAGGLFWLITRVEYDEFDFSFGLGRMTEYLELPVWLHHGAMVVMGAIVMAFFLIRGVGVLVGHDPFPEVERDPADLED